jgi:hypothetical protein
MVVLLLPLQYFLMRSSRNGQSRKLDIGIDTAIQIRKWWRGTLSAKFQFLRLFTRVLKSGNLMVSIGPETIGVNRNVDHGINSDSSRSGSNPIW